MRDNYHLPPLAEHSRTHANLVDSFMRSVAILLCGVMPFIVAHFVNECTKTLDLCVNYVKNVPFAVNQILKLTVVPVGNKSKSLSGNLCTCQTASRHTTDLIHVDCVLATCFREELLLVLPDDISL